MVAKRKTRLKLALFAGTLSIIALIVAVVFVLPGYHRRSVQNLAVPALEEYVQSHPDDFTAVERMGEICLRTNQLPQASDLLLKSYEHDPSRLDLLNDYSLSLVLQQRYEPARLVLEGLVRTHPENKTAWANLGRLYMVLARPRDAVRALTQVTRLDPHDRNAMLGLAQAYEGIGLASDAEHWYQEILQQDAGNTGARLGLALLYARTGRQRLADKTLDLPHHAKEPESLATAGDLALVSKDPSLREAANDLFRQASTLRPDDVSLLQRQAASLEATGHNAEAIPVLQHILGLEPDNRAAAEDLEKVRHAGSGGSAPASGKGENNPAETSGNGNNNAAPTPAPAVAGEDPRLVLARSFLQQGQYEKALQQCNAVLGEQPQNAQARSLRLQATAVLSSEASAYLKHVAPAGPTSAPTAVH